MHSPAPHRLFTTNMLTRRSRLVLKSCNFVLASTVSAPRRRYHVLRPEALSRYRDQRPYQRHKGCVATFKKRQESDWSGRPRSVSCSHLEQLVDELNLSPNIQTAHPPRLPLPDHVHCLVSLDRSARRVKLAKALLGLHSSFDRSMILLQDIAQVLDRPVAATASQDSFFFHSWNRRAVEACLIGVDDAGICACDGSLRALRNSRLAAAASRSADSRKSLVAPVESMARYK